MPRKRWEHLKVELRSKSEERVIGVDWRRRLLDRSGIEEISAESREIKMGKVSGRGEEAARAEEKTN